MRIPLLALGLFALVPAADATPIRYDFLIDGATVTGAGFPSGPANGSGYVIFDTDLAFEADATGHVGNGHTPLPTLGLSFDWFGQHYDATNATLGGATFSGGLPIGWQIDSLAESSFCTPAPGSPFDRFDCVQFGTADFTLSAFFGGTGVALLSWADLPNSYARAAVSWTRGQIGEPEPEPTRVPEPATLGLMVLGMAGVVLRRRKASHG